MVSSGKARRLSKKATLGGRFSWLRKLDLRDSKPSTGTTITTEEFKTHFERVGRERCENTPGGQRWRTKGMTPSSKRPMIV